FFRRSYICLLLSPLHRCVAYPSRFNHPAPTDISTLSLHDALPISAAAYAVNRLAEGDKAGFRATLDPTVPLARTIFRAGQRHGRDRKSTRLNSSHVKISYAVFCLKKKKTIQPSRCREMAGTSTSSR